MKELITRIEELAVQTARDARQIETLQGLLLASQSALEAELTEAISRNKAQDEVRTLRAEVETLKHERDSAINECERLRAESKATIGELQAKVADARNELNALHREANKRGRINSDLVAVIRKGWEDADRAAQLEGELRNEIKNHGDMRNEAQALRAELLQVQEAADACGRTEGESVVEFMKRVKQETRYT